MIDRVDVEIVSRDFWFKVVDFLQQNWALVERGGAGCKVFFISDTSGVFDELEFQSVDEAVDALRGNRFQRYEGRLEAHRYLTPPKEPFFRKEHPNGAIYSSGRFWNSN